PGHENAAAMAATGEAPALRVSPSTRQSGVSPVPPVPPRLYSAIWCGPATMMPQHLAEGPDSKEASVRSHPMTEEPATASQPADLTPSLLAHARSALPQT